MGHNCQTYILTKDASMRRQQGTLASLLLLKASHAVADVKTVHMTQFTSWHFPAGTARLGTDAHEVLESTLGSLINALARYG